MGEVKKTEAEKVSKFGQSLIERRWCSQEWNPGLLLFVCDLAASLCWWILIEPQHCHYILLQHKPRVPWYWLERLREQLLRAENWVCWMTSDTWESVHRMKTDEGKAVAGPFLIPGLYQTITQNQDFDGCFCGLIRKREDSFLPLL